MTLTFDIHDALDDVVSAYIAEKVRLHKHHSAPDYFLEDGSPADWKALTITLRDDHENLIGALTGSTMFGGMHISWLWVEEEHRHQGHARALLNQAIDVAKARDCTFLYGDTWSAQGAHSLYEKLGAKVIMRMDNYPPGSSLIRYRMDLD